MIKLYAGTGGSGKSLAVVRDLLHNHNQYQKLYINVAGFNIEAFRKATGNYDIEIITFEPHTYPEQFLLMLTDIKDEAEELPENERVKTLLVYDEASFSLRDYSTRDDLSQEISNFIALHRHYGPCDMIWMTQGFKKIHSKFQEDVEYFYEALPFAKRMDPENDIVFDEMDPDDTKKVLQGGQSRIKFKKLETFTGKDGKNYQYFDFYVSGDGGRANVRKNGWKKYLYILALLLLFVVGLFYYVISNIFGSVAPSVKQNDTTEKATPQNVAVAPKDLNQTVTEEKDIFDKYKHEYDLISSQRMFKIYRYKNLYYFGDVVLSAKDFLFLVEDNSIRLLTNQPVTKESSYLTVMVHINVANALGLIKNFDFNDDGSKNKNVTMKNE